MTFELTKKPGSDKLGVHCELPLEDLEGVGVYVLTQMEQRIIQWERKGEPFNLSGNGKGGRGVLCTFF